MIICCLIASLLAPKICIAKIPAFLAPFKATVATGTPAGVGAAQNPPRFLKEGDEIKITVEGIGTLTTVIGE